MRTYIFNSGFRLSMSDKEYLKPEEIRTYEAAYGRLNFVQVNYKTIKCL